MSSGFPDWTRAYLLIGSHEGELIPVYVDADGKLFAALQGEYKGELRTIALDDQGRISAFVIDSSDAWGQMLTVGNAELAARLGSLVNQDRRGQVIFATDWRDGPAGIDYDKYGTGTLAFLDPTHFVTGGYSYQCYCPAGTSHFVDIRREFGGPWATNIGISTLLRMTSGEGMLYLRIRQFTGSLYYHLGIAFDGYTKHLYYLNEAGDWVIIPGTGEVTRSTYSWNFLKLVADLEAHTYLRCIWDQNEYSMAGLSRLVRASVDVPRIVAIIRASAGPDHNEHIWIDNMIVTGAEQQE